MDCQVKKLKNEVSFLNKCGMCDMELNKLLMKLTNSLNLDEK